jgi:cell division protein FtsQ
VAADAWFCWRVLDGPASRDGTVAAARPAAPAVALSRVRPRASRKLGNLRTASLAAALAGALAFVGLTDGGRYARETPPLIQEVDSLAEFAGFGLHQVSITGHRFTPAAAIFDAFDLVNVRSLLRFDSIAVRERIERLPWVETASITRLMPDQVGVHIVERTPFAVWHRGGREMLIDATGRTLATAVGSWDLPRVAGEGALAEAGEILALVGKHPELFGRLEIAARVSERRWTLRLIGGPDVYLPADGVPEALARLMAAHAQGRLLEPPSTIIDMRSDERIVVRRASSDDHGRSVEPRGEQAVP